MSADWSKPALTDTEANYLAYLSARLDDSAKLFRSDTVTATNTPVGIIRWNAASSSWEAWGGAAWAALAATYGINISGNAATASTAAAAPWSGITGKPNTVSGYGITDAITTATIGLQTVAAAGTAGSATTAGVATHLAGGSAGTIAYQSGAGTTVQLAAGTAGQFLQCNGGAAPSWVTPPVSAPHGSNKFTANGTWTSPAGVTTCWLTLMGGGGGSSGGAVGYGANGGGGGGFINRVQYTCAANTAYAVTIGAGGAGGASTTGTAGSTGGTTSVGALATVAGGAGGGATATAGLGGAGGPGNQSGMGGCAYLAGNGGGVGGGTAGGGAGTAGTAGQANTGGGGGGPFNINIIGNAGGSGYVVIEW